MIPGSPTILWISEGDLVSLLVDALRKIALSLQRSWHHEISSCAWCVRGPDLLGEEEKQFVLVAVESSWPVNGSADVVSNRVKAISRPRESCLVIKRIVGVERLVASVVVALAVKISSSRFGRNVDDRSATLSIFSLVVVEQNFDFGDRLHVEWRVKPVAAPSRIPVNAVETDGIAHFARTGNRSCSRGAELRTSFSVFDHSGQEPDQSQGIATGSTQMGNFVAVEQGRAL